MRIEKIQANILSTSSWLTASVLSTLLDVDNSSSLLFQWKSEKKLFSVIFEGAEYYPHYALEMETGYLPIKSLHPILIEFGSAKNEWGLAYWFSSPNSFLAGLLPKDLLKTEPIKVLEATKYELLGIQHG